MQPEQLIHEALSIAPIAELEKMSFQLLQIGDVFRAGLVASILKERSESTT
jgi:hypothetical protein